MEKGRRDKNNMSIAALGRQDSCVSLHSSVRSFQEWTCAACSYRNDVDFSTCSVCGLDQPIMTATCEWHSSNICQQQQEKDDECRKETLDGVVGRKNGGGVQEEPKRELNRGESAVSQEQQDQPRTSSQTTVETVSGKTRPRLSRRNDSIRPSVREPRSREEPHVRHLLSCTSTTNTSTLAPADDDNNDETWWNCRLCTFTNTNPMHLACELCGQEKNVGSSTTSTCVLTQQEYHLDKHRQATQEDELKEVRRLQLEEYIAFQEELLQQLLQDEREQHEQQQEQSSSCFPNTQVSRCA